MKTLILDGSPSENGDTVSLIRKAAEKTAGEYKLINVYRCNITEMLIPKQNRDVMKERT